MYLVTKAFNTTLRRFKEGMEFLREEFEGSEDHLKNLIDLGHVEEKPEAENAPSATTVSAEQEEDFPLIDQAFRTTASPVSADPAPARSIDQAPAPKPVDTIQPVAEHVEVQSPAPEPVAPSAAPPAEPAAPPAPEHAA